MRLSYFLLPTVAACFVGFSCSAEEQKNEMIAAAKSENSFGNFEKSSLTTRVEALEEQYSKLPKEKFLKTDSPLHGYTKLDVLCWKGKGNDQFYAAMLDYPPLNFAVAGKWVRAENEWKPGARFEIGFSTVNDWDIGAIWTYYRNRSVSSKSSNFNTLAPNILQIFPTQAAFHYHLNYNTLDLQFLANCYLLKRFVFKPFIDVRGAWIEFSDRSHYTGINPQISGIPADDSWIISHSWWGVGPRVGAGAVYKFGRCGFSVMGDCSASLLYGRLHVKESLKGNVQFNPVSGTQTTPLFPIEFRDGFGDLKASLELMVGANYRWGFDHGKKSLCVHAAWETNYWWDQGDYFTAVEGQNSPDVSETSESLILYGVNVGLGFDY